MTTEDKFRDEKLHNGINREASKISPLSSSQIDKYEYLTGEKIWLSDLSRVIEQAKFTDTPLGKAFEKQIKTTEDVAEKQLMVESENKS